MANIKGMIFDMDGVLTETSENHFLAWSALAETLGFTLDRSVNEGLKGISRMASLELVLKAGHMADRFTEEEKLALATKKNDLYLNMIEKFTRADLLDGVEEFFVKLKAEGVKIGVASASRSAAMLTKKLGIDSYVDYIVDPDTVPGKPKPDIFLKAAQGLNLHPLECVGVEDAAAGIFAIKAAGMMAVGIGYPMNLKGADICYLAPKDMDYEEITRLYHKFMEEQA